MDNLFIFGDSITHGEFDAEGGGWATRLKTHIYERRLAGGSALYAYPLGIPAEMSAGVVQRFFAEIKAREDPGESGAVILATGINDSKVSDETGTNLVPLETFRSNYEKMLAELQQNGYTPIAVGLTRVNESAPRKSTRFINSEINKYDSVIRSLCEQKKAVYVEMGDLFLDRQDLLVDSVHPNAEGHRLMFERVKGELEKMGIL